MFNGSYLVAVAPLGTGAKVGFLTGGGVVLLLGGYVAPGIKEVALKFAGAGVTLITHDKDARTKADVDLSDELASGETVVIEESEAVETARFFLASQALEWILTGGPFLEDCVLHLYLYDADVGGLVPTRFETNDMILQQPPWKPGEGVTGKAYSTGFLQLLFGDQTQPLDPARREQHPGLIAVAATPIFNNAETIIGVLAASERNVEIDESVLRTADGQAELVARGDLAARVLIDLLAWFTDEE
jgi:hypothetical protein